MRRCVICGARVENLNPKCLTCDPICTRAKKSGRTRANQYRVDIMVDDARAKEDWIVKNERGKE